MHIQKLIARQRQPTTQDHPLGQTLRISNRLSELQIRLDRLLPLDLIGRVLLSLDKDGTWMLLVRDNYAATRVRLLLPDIQALLNSRQDATGRASLMQPSGGASRRAGLRIRVAPVNPTPPRRLRRARPIPAEMGDLLRELARECQDEDEDELRDAIEKLADRAQKANREP